MKKFVIELSDELVSFYRDKIDDNMKMEKLLPEMLGLLKEILENSFSKIFIDKKNTYLT